MNEALVNLLLKEYKQSLILKDLEKLGIEVHSLHLELYNIVFDLVGIPKDNTIEYNINPDIEGEHNDQGLKSVDENYFSRDYFNEQWFDIKNTVLEENISINHKGVQLGNTDESVVLDKIETFVDWLKMENRFP